MKEVEQNNIADVGKNIGYIDLYKKCSDIPSRLRFIVDYRKMLAAKEVLSNKVSDEEYAAIDEIEEEFKNRYIYKGSPDTIKLIFETLGRINGENNYECIREYERQLDNLPDNTKNPEKCARWLTEHTESGLYNRVINGVTASMTIAVNDSDSVFNRMWKNSKLKESSTVKDYALSIGIPKGQLDDFYRTYNISAKDNVMTYIKRLNPGVKINLNDLATRYTEDSARYLLRNGAENYYHEQGIEDGSSLRADIDRYTIKNKKEPSSADDINGWIKSTGEKKARNRHRSDARKIISIFESKYISGKPELDMGEDQIIYDYKLKYNKAVSMEEKLEVIIECSINNSYRGKHYRLAYDVDDFIYAMIEDFTDTYIANGDDAVVRSTMEHLGKVGALSTHALMVEDEKYKSEYANEGKAGAQKADALAWKTKAGMKAVMVKKLLDSASTKYMTKSLSAKTRFAESGLNPKSTYGDYLRGLKIPEEEIVTKAFEHKGAKPEDNVMDVLFGNEEKMDEDAALYSLETKFLKDSFKRMIEKGSDPVIKRLDNEQCQKFMGISEKLNTEVSYSKIEDWMNNEGKKRLNLIEDTVLGCGFFSKTDVDKSVKSYDNYISLHLGEDILDKNNGFKNDCLLKLLAANDLKRSGVKFSVERIHKLANKMKNRPEYTDLFGDKELVDYALACPENFNKYQLEKFGEPFKVSAVNVKDYIKDMNKLYKSIMSPEGRSDEYKAFVKSVKSISELDAKYDFKQTNDLEAAAKEVTALNMQLLSTVQNYIAGKEKVRTFSDGNARFSNALDSLAILSASAPKVKDFVKGMVDNINTIRKVKPGSSKYVDLAQYGAVRAAESKKFRESASKKNDNKKVQEPVKK